MIIDSIFKEYINSISFRQIMFCHQEIVYLHMFYLHLIISFVVLPNILLVLFDQVCLFFCRSISLIKLYFIVDFMPAINNMTPCTPITDGQINPTYPRTSSTNSMDGLVNDEVTRLHEQYRKLVQKNREYI